MEIIYFTVAGIFLYFFSDWVLDRLEAMAGRRFEYRSLIFFVIILVLSMSLFNIVQYFQAGDTESSPEKVMMDKPDGGEVQDKK
ncbi:MAG TPA: hypothetical protein ENK38_04145 [Gammaproteobacteria bacterium]|nr:hypothetical protein [Gammaproteobacteria bacterium]